MDLLREAFRQRRERVQELGQAVEGKERKPSPKDRLQEPELAESAKKALRLIDRVPDVRGDRVEEIKKGLEEGSLTFDSKSVADRMLQESILNELL